MSPTPVNYIKDNQIKLILSDTRSNIKLLQGNNIEYAGTPKNVVVKPIMLELPVLLNNVKVLVSLCSLFPLIEWSKSLHLQITVALTVYLFESHNKGKFTSKKVGFLLSLLFPLPSV